MKRSLNRVLLGTVAAGCATLLLAVGSWSMDHRVAAPDPQQATAYMSAHLSLDESQEASIEELLRNAMSESAEDRARIGSLRDALREQRGAFDEQQARAFAEEIGEIMARMVYRRASTQAEIYELLDADQRAAMDSLGELRAQQRQRPRSRF